MDYGKRIFDILKPMDKMKIKKPKVSEHQNHGLGLCTECESLEDVVRQSDNDFCPACRSVDTMQFDIEECSKCSEFKHIDTLTDITTNLDKYLQYICTDCYGSQESGAEA